MVRYWSIAGWWPSIIPLHHPSWLSNNEGNRWSRNRSGDTSSPFAATSSKTIERSWFCRRYRPTRSTRSRVQDQLTSTAATAKELGLAISFPETEYMTLNCDQHPPLKVYGESTKHVPDFEYLFNVTCSSNDLKRHLGLAWGTFWKLEHLWRSNKLLISRPKWNCSTRHASQTSFMGVNPKLTLSQHLALKELCSASNERIESQIPRYTPGLKQNNWLSKL